MKHIYKLVFMFCLLSFGTTLQAQNAITVGGGNATGSGGTVSYTVGQIVYNTITETTGIITQGVQQPYEISIATSIENTEEITLGYKVYPNPTSGFIILFIKSFDSMNIRFLLLDFNGILLQNKKIESVNTEISFEKLPSSVYILKVIVDNLEVKTFKIIKN
jgi:hypothetical protein